MSPKGQIIGSLGSTNLGHLAMISGDIDCLHHFHGQSDKRTDFGGIDVDGSELLLPGTLAGLAGLAIGSLAAGVWAMTVDADSPTPGQLTVTQATAPSATRLARGGELVHLKVRVKDVDAKHSSGVSLSVSFPMAGPYRDIPRSQSASCQRNFLHPNKSEECTISTTATPRQVESAVVQVVNHDWRNSISPPQNGKGVFALGH